MRSPYRRIVCLLCLLSGLWADTWYNDYDQALRAIKGQRWAQAITLLHGCLSKKDRPKAQARTVGLEFVDYLPYFHLGLAHYQQQDYKLAQETLLTEKGYGEINKFPTLVARLDTLLAECKDRLQPRVDDSPPAIKTDSTPIKTEPPIQIKQERPKELPPEPQSETQKAPLTMQKKSQSEPAKEGNLLNKAQEDLIGQLLRQGDAELSHQAFEKARAQYETVLKIQPSHEAALLGMNRIERSQAILAVNQVLRLYFSSQSKEAESGFEAILAEPNKEAKVRDLCHRFLAVICIERHLVDPHSEQGHLNKAKRHLGEVMNSDFSWDKRFFSPKVIKALTELSKDKPD